MNIIKIVTSLNRKFLKGDGLNIVRFYAEWSGPCQIMEPIYVEMSLSYKNTADFYQVDIDEVPKLKHDFGVHEVPTILFLKHGKIVDFTIGLISREELIEKLENAIGII